MCKNQRLDQYKSEVFSCAEWKNLYKYKFLELINRSRINQ
jgi:hypothetical protein